MGNWGFWLAAIIRHISSIGCIAILMWQIFGCSPSIINNLDITFEGFHFCHISLQVVRAMVSNSCIIFFQNLARFVSDEISIN